MKQITAKQFRFLLFYPLLHVVLCVLVIWMVINAGIFPEPGDPSPKSWQIFLADVGKWLMNIFLMPSTYFLQYFHLPLLGGFCWIFIMLMGGIYGLGFLLLYKLIKDR